MTVGLVNNSTGTPNLVAQTDLAGNLIITSVYQQANDIPSQYAALQQIYDATGGDHWNSAYKQVSAADTIDDYEATLSSTSKFKHKSNTQICLLKHSA